MYVYGWFHNYLVHLTCILFLFKFLYRLFYSSFDISDSFACFSVYVSVHFAWLFYVLNAWLHKPLSIWVNSADGKLLIIFSFFPGDSLHFFSIWSGKNKSLCLRIIFDQDLCRVSHICHVIRGQGPVVQSIISLTTLARQHFGSHYFLRHAWLSI